MSAVAAGAAAAQRIIDDAEEYEETLEEAVARLAALPPLKYDQVRDTEAEALGVRCLTLDAEVKKARGPAVGTGGRGNAKQGHAIAFDEPKPWPKPVDGVALLGGLIKAIRSYVAMSDDTTLAVALWVIHTYLLDHFMISPRLAITSPVRRCGKTTLLDVLECLVKKPLIAANVTASTVFRVAEMSQPTLLVDEADTFLNGGEALLGIMNAGHRRGGKVIRGVGDDFEPRQFSVYGAVAIAHIGGLPTTLADRSVPIQLQRRRRDEPVEKFKRGRTERLDELARQITRWTADNSTAIGAARPTMPAGMHDRAEDNWEPLLAIADQTGSDWPEKARQAARTLAPTDDDDASIGGQLLADTKAIFADKGNPDWLSSEEVVGTLGKMEGRSWPEWSNGKPITQNALARLFADYSTGVKGRYIRPIKRDDKRGYELASFKDAFSRYLQFDIASHHADNAAQPSNRPESQKSAFWHAPQPSGTEAERTVGVDGEPLKSAVSDGWTVGEGHWRNYPA